MLWRELKRLYGLEKANTIIEHQLSGDIYINDMHGIGSSKVYCFNYSMYDVMMNGLPMIEKPKSLPPKSLYAFKSQVEQFSIIAANSTLGACGIADLFIVMSYYIDQIFKTGKDAHTYFDGWFSDEEKRKFSELAERKHNLITKTGEHYIEEFEGSIMKCTNRTEPHDKEWFTMNVWRYVRESLASFLYSINQPLRQNQSLFANVSLYDDSFLDSMCLDYIFPDGSTPNKDTVRKLQEVFLSTMNAELKRTVYTFPVVTSCFAKDDDGNLVKGSLYDILPKYAREFSFVNIYTGKTSVLSSCCFDKEQGVIIQIDNEEVVGTFEDLYNEYHAFDGMVVYSTDEWVPAKFVRVMYNDDMYRITTDLGSVISVTKDHIHLTDDGDKITTQLKIGDYLKSNSYNINLSDEEIVNIETYKYSGYVYCFEIDKGYEPYFMLANGIITHNCRLRSDTSNEYFNSFGAGSSKIGSLGVVTVNMPRLAEKCKGDKDKFIEGMLYFTDIASKINNAKRHIVRKKIENGNLPLYTLGFMELQKQYSTLGVNGIYEALEYLNLDITTEEGLNYLTHVLDEVNKRNDMCAKQYNAPHNIENIPAENVSIKLVQKDNKLGYNKNKYILYSNQFIPLIYDIDVLERVRLQGALDTKFSGGNTLHVNCETKIKDDKTYQQLIDYCADKGVVYWSPNYNIQECVNGHVTVGKNVNCVECGNPIKENYTRVVGFITPVKNWNQTRREIDYPNRKFYEKLEVNNSDEHSENAD